MSQQTGCINDDLTMLQSIRKLFKAGIQTAVYWAKAGFLNLGSTGGVGCVLWVLGYLCSILNLHPLEVSSPPYRNAFGGQNHFHVVTTELEWHPRWEEINWGVTVESPFSFFKKRP